MKQPSHPPLTDAQLERLDAAWETLEQGDPEQAFEMADALKRELSGHPEARMLAGAALLDLAEPEQALEELESARGHVSDGPLLAFYLAGAYFELGRLVDAERLLRGMVEIEPQEPAGHYGLAEVLEHLGRQEEAEQLFERAHELNPPDYPLPLRMTREAFQEVVREASGLLPDELQAPLARIPIVVQDLPKEEALDPEAGPPVSPGVWGLFVGRSLRDESVFEAGDLPPTVYIYQRNLERSCSNREELIEEITTTLYHEVGHYLGLDEEDLEERGID